jgi:predicted  nucleic acid-binding Zn-ribbon protein
MTYKELLYDLAEKTAETYNLYLESKISSVVDPDNSLPERIEQHRAEHERLEKKLVALLATVKNEGSTDAEAADDFYEEFLKE